MKASKILSFAVFLFIICLMISVNGLANSLIFLLALFIHEGFHYICGAFLGENLGIPLIGLLGLRFEPAQNTGYGLKWVLIYLSGALGNIMFAFSIVFLEKFISIPNADMFVFYNLLFASVNLIPAFPMDSARALCCILSLKFSRIHSVKITAFVSELIAYTMFLVGTYIFIFKTDNMILLLLSVSIFYYSGKEMRSAQADFIKGKLNKLSALKHRDTFG